MTRLRLPLVKDDYGLVCINPQDATGHMWVRPSLVYYGAEVARAIFASLAFAWDNDLFQGEGWAMFNTDHALSCGIERFDEEGLFDTDNDAITHVQARASRGSQPHANAIILHHACDSLRFHEWGPEYVDSRLGPKS